MLWVSTTGSDKLAMMWMHSHYQSVYPYKGIPSVIPPEPPIPFTPYVPTIDTEYNWTTDNGYMNSIVIDQVYKWDIDYESRLIKYYAAIDSEYKWEFIPLSDIVIYDSDTIGLGENYEFN